MSYYASLTKEQKIQLRAKFAAARKETDIFVSKMLSYASILGKQYTHEQLKYGRIHTSYIRSVRDQRVVFESIPRQYQDHWLDRMRSGFNFSNEVEDEEI